MLPPHHGNWQTLNSSTTPKCPTQEQGHLRITSMNVAALECWGATLHSRCDCYHCIRSLPSTGIFLLYVLYWNILDVTIYPPLEYSCCMFSTGTFLLLTCTLQWNTLGVCSLLEFSWCTFSTGTFFLLPCTLQWDIHAVRSLLEHSCCYPIPSNGIFLLYVLYWNILAVTLYPSLELSVCYCTPAICSAKGRKHLQFTFPTFC
jgi:hypothetical protein